MSKITQLKDIEIYVEALRLTQKIYVLCKEPTIKYEYSLQDQVKRAAISVAANIAEGFGRRTPKDFIHFLSISLGSSNEVIAYLDFLELQFKIPVQSLKSDYETLSKRIISFRRYLTNN